MAYSISASVLVFYKIKNYEKVDNLHWWYLHEFPSI
jgi:hypothetical protein